MKQVTQEQYDERFYHDEKLVNTQTKSNWFPSVTHILKWKATAPQLMEWIGNKGYEESQRIMKRKGNIGSYVHDVLEQMMKDGKVYTTEMIELDFPDEKEALFVKRCLRGAMNWVADMTKKYKDFKILEAEQPVFAKDYAGTIDIVIRADGKTWVIDFKTSKNIYDSHRIQIVAYRKAKKANRAAILQLGNRTRQRYTFSEVKYKEGLRRWREFGLIKGLFYSEHPDARPTREDFPEKFSLPKIK